MFVYTRKFFFLKAKWMKRLPRGTLSPRWVDEGTVTSKTSCRAAGNKCRVNPATRNAYKGLEVKVPRPGPSGADHAADARQGSMRWQRHLAISSFYCRYLKVVRVDGTVPVAVDNHGAETETITFWHPGHSLEASTHPLMGGELRSGLQKSVRFAIVDRVENRVASN